MQRASSFLGYHHLMHQHTLQRHRCQRDIELPLCFNCEWVRQLAELTTGHHARLSNTRLKVTESGIHLGKDGGIMGGADEGTAAAAAVGRGQTGRAHPHSPLLSHSISISRSHSAEPRPNCQVTVTVACEWNFKSLLASSYTMRDPTKGVLGSWCNLWTCWVSMVVHLLNLTCQTLHRLILFLHCGERSEGGGRMDKGGLGRRGKKENSERKRTLCVGLFILLRLKDVSVR